MVFTLAWYRGGASGGHLTSLTHTLTMVSNTKVRSLPVYVPGSNKGGSPLGVQEWDKVLLNEQF